jgi:ATP-dependent DNA helicase RecG
MPERLPIGWLDPVTALRGVGPERAAQLEALGIRQVGDLLLHAPRRHEDRRTVRPVASLAVGDTALVRGRVVALGVKWWRRRTQSVFELVLDDGQRRLYCRWWNQPYQERNFASGQELLVYGRVSQLRPPTMDQPETEVMEAGEGDSVHVCRIVPVYPLTEGLPQRWLRRLVWRVLEEENTAVPDRLGTLDGQRPSRADALRHLHFPRDWADVEAARERLALEELAELHLTVQERRRRLLARSRGRCCRGDNRLIRPFLRALGFSPTAPQLEVLREIRQALAGPAPMRRLLQGDVGSGKTVVAACAALMTLESGYSVVLMAPTEILAEQHRVVLGRWLEPLGIEVRLVTANHPADPCGDSATRAPPPRLTVGTHALLEDAVDLADLGLVIIDEQHRFGVAQRERLVRKGECPHLLVMTATPIPRTLGLTLYGDLDISTLLGRPPGRGRTRTFIRSEQDLGKVWAFAQQQVDQGRQVYVVYPRVEETEPGDVKAVVKEWKRLRDLFHPRPVGLLHGRMSGTDKESVMRNFGAGSLSVLVATSVIEVGLDVPNATVMVIEGAEQFGLAQLHQLRGRIGRGTADSTCILVPHKDHPDTRRRLQVLVETEDGFRVAEEDLRLRGPGDFLGRRQSGLPALRFVDFSRDLALAREAKTWAQRDASARRC